MKNIEKKYQDGYFLDNRGVNGMNFGKDATSRYINPMLEEESNEDKKTESF